MPRKLCAKVQLLVTLREATPAHEAAQLERDFERAGSTRYSA